MQRDYGGWTAEIVIGSIGLFIGVATTVAWRTTPAFSVMGAAIITSVLAYLFSTAHYAGTPLKAALGRVGQLLIGTAEGILLMATFFHP